jgi:DEAD/DEAH box helicase/Domain of unknown function (DUF1998)/Helicase conserved C-terminal domain
MDVFSLSENLTKQYTTFARSFTKIRSTELKEKVDELYAGRKFWPEPLLQLNPHYEGGGSVRHLVGSPAGLDSECANIFLDPRAKPNDPDLTLKLRRHQEQAISLALAGKSFVVTTGTGSGKSLCFFIPIIDAVIKAKRAGETARTRAVIIYPMNALANSQLEELKKFLGARDGGIPVTFARYTGQESSEERERIRHNPPDILLTNFMMLELLMTRQSDLDQSVIENCRGLRFMVLDELHTYRGRQGADVAMLMRRLRARVGAPERPPICIGTSATMASEGLEENRNLLVAGVASKLFGTKISSDAIITETLRRATDENRSADQGLVDLPAAVLRAGSETVYEGMTNATVAQDELAIWVETRLGLQNVEKKPERAKPVSLKNAASILAKDSGCSFSECELALRNSLLAFSQTEVQRGCAQGLDEPLFAFKLHQFISGAGRLYSTLDQPGKRTVTFDGQIFDPDNPEKRLFSAHFCRNCGQEHHPVTFVDKLGNKHFEKREIDDVPLNDEDAPDDANARWGFIMLEPIDGEFQFDGDVDSYPESWTEQTKAGELRLKAAYRKNRAELVSVLPDGTTGANGRRAWFMPGRFRFCAACGDYYSDSTRDINRLAALSAEGRSSATTIIIATILQWMNEPDNAIAALTRKLLAFTDNRQDAALQAGHFNDFLFVTLLRGAILAVLQQAGEEGIQEDQVGSAIQQALGLVAANQSRRSEWLFEPAMKGANLINAEKTLRESLAHRFWIDQRRGWRYTNPNLEQLGMIEAQYLAVDEVVAEDSLFDNSPFLARASPQERKTALVTMFDVMRRGLAIECDALDRSRIEGLASRMRGVIKPTWTLDEDRFLSAPVFLSQPPRGRDLTLKDEQLILRGSAASIVGRELRKMTFGGLKAKGAQITQIIETLLAAASQYGLVTRMESPFSGDGWRLLPQAIRFKYASNIPSKGDNSFFRALYSTIAEILANGGEALFGFEGREHTAQVEGDLRELREARFRYGADDQKNLKENAELLRTLREDGRFLPALFCSPTMELGVDISSMNVVYMRNVPPTPANYAQRGGRAGRSGQAALIVTYCAAQSPHDQYFFQRPDAMVDGIVVPPAIDLSNPDLVESHLQAEWLAASGVDLASSIAENLAMTEAGKPLRSDIVTGITSDETREAARARVSSVLEVLSKDYQAALPDWFQGVSPNTEAILQEAPERFSAAFTRWRDLLAAAERQVDDATAALKDYSISPQERKAAEGRQAAGNVQIKLLLRGAEGQGSDFYVYRYLATEGFLPGYNFPRLPLMAFIPGGQGGKGQRYIQRARFLALSEFGPSSLVYHEGQAYRVDRALLKDVGGPDGMLPTFSTSTCPMCGAGHDGEPPERCHVCKHPLSGADIVRDLYRIENVGTRQVERITANDEERRRQGFELQTTFSFEKASDIHCRTVEDTQGEVLSVEFAPAARVRRINRGLRRRKDPGSIGFWIAPRSGYWVGEEDPNDDNGSGKEKQPRQRIAPVVEDRKNALLIRFPLLWLEQLHDDRGAVVATIQHALARGVEAIYQLEEGEILAEPTPQRSNRRALLFYEAAEGGAGALSRLIQEPTAFAQVAKKALEIMHYVPESLAAAAEKDLDQLQTVPDPRCVAGCYRCLLSYFNQPDHESIDRRLPAVLAFLLRLAFAEVKDVANLYTGTFALDNCPPPDPKPLEIDGFQIEWIWRASRVAAVEDASAPANLTERLASKGIDLMRLPREKENREPAIAQLASLLNGK